MKKYTIAALIFSAVAATTMTASLPAAAQRDSFSFSFDTGDVRFAYRDGYYDHNRRWHKWRSSRESRAYRERYSDSFNDGRRSSYPNRGWRDQDGDGVPNNRDRDRDGDGVSNRNDNAPNNPRRD